MAAWGADLTVKPPVTEPFKPVWVDLDQLYPQAAMRPGSCRTNDATGSS